MFIKIKMKILVTGATGFIRKPLVRKLVKKRHKVKCLVRKTSQKRDINYLKKLKVDCIKLIRRIFKCNTIYY